MQRRNRRMWIAGAGALGLALLVASPPRAAIEILTHRVGDPAPHRLQAAVDLGIVAVSVLVTWSRNFTN